MKGGHQKQLRDAVSESVHGRIFRQPARLVLGSAFKMHLETWEEHSDVGNNVMCGWEPNDVNFLSLGALLVEGHHALRP